MTVLLGIFGFIGAGLFFVTLPQIAAMTKDCPFVRRSALLTVNVGGFVMVLEAVGRSGNSGAGATVTLSGGARG